MKQKNNIHLYLHKRLDINEIFYVGIGADKRPYSKKDRNKWWKNIVNKTPYEVIILESNLTWLEACNKEKELIKLYGRKDLGTGILVNMTGGGDGAYGIKMSEEHKQKISKALIGNIYASGNKGVPKSIETKKKMSLAVLGKKRGPMSKEHKDKLSISHKGRIFSDETRRRLSIALKGKPKSESAKLNMSFLRTQKNNYHIVCVTTNEKFDSFKLAGRHFKVSYQAIRQSIINNHLCKGLLFEKVFK